MALPALLKHIYNNATEEVIKRGKKILIGGQVQLTEHDELLHNATFRVRDDAYAIFYKVTVQHYHQQPFTARCSCPYNISEVCRHNAAALFKLQDLLDKNLLGEKTNQYNQKHTVIKMKELDVKMMKMLSNKDSFREAEQYLLHQKAQIKHAQDERVEATVNMLEKEFKLVFYKNQERNIDTSCNCGSEIYYPLCTHKLIVLLQLYKEKGPLYFDSIRNWDLIKNKLLSLYGYSLSDNLKGKFEFTYVNERPFLRVLDPSIKKVDNPIPIVPQKKESFVPVLEEEEEGVDEKANALINKKLSIVLSHVPHIYPYIQFDIVESDTDEQAKLNLDKVEKIDLNKFIETEHYSDGDKFLIQLLRKFLPTELLKYVERNTPFSTFDETPIIQIGDENNEERKKITAEYYYPKLKKLFEDFGSENNFFLLTNKLKYNTANLQLLRYSTQQATPFIEVNYNAGVYTVACKVNLFFDHIPIQLAKIQSPVLFVHDKTIYTWSKEDDIHVVDTFLPNGFIEVTEGNWSKYLNEYLLPLTRNYKIDFGNLHKTEIRGVQPTMQLVLEERSGYLVFNAVFNYNQYQIQGIDNEKVIFCSNGQVIIVHRNMEEEQEKHDKIRLLHSNFVQLDHPYSIALKVEDVLKNNWFFLFVDTLQELQIELLGFESLKKFKFNTYKPSTRIYISSDTDWFDAKVEVVFGDQMVTISDIKHAIANKQQYVTLKDGTLGILPEDWLKKYSLLFKVGEGKNNHLKLNKYQVSVIDDLYEQRNAEEIYIQLEEQYDSIKNRHEIQRIDPPKHLSKTLRPYQKSGFQWLNYLKEVKWGGILADDMGLGKTLQALTFISHLKQNESDIKVLVVCPTSLMFNWKNEITKFTPELSYHIHHGGGRQKDDVPAIKEDIIITTYGTLRSDISSFKKIKFNYVVLDESQAIKNPSSKIAKAVCLLQANLKLCLSGTPLQNNTFDLYAQMNFLNPGMLGSIEFFKQEFAVPIDKFGLKEHKEHLRKLLFPFILRRTKEQVAKDLPEKQEMVLYCEMSADQRNIYDAYRNEFRSKILGLVETVGIQKSQLSILQGLMKLRQICDSPAILNEDEKYPNVSVKLDELGREISENISNHKALIFSQFLGMLSLIKQKMRELGIAYEYFDGSSSATERERAVTRFQNDDECRVFIISLKAGGVGLNLTAADYVYIVDPWWNPAVEQQAIDRTHRIGQTKNIFAYRMICTETVEDKIIELQARKKSLAKELVSDEEGFVKQLTREDVEYLFS